MSAPIFAETLLVNPKMFAGKIVQQLTHDEMKTSMDELFEAIVIRGGKLSPTYVMLCKLEMSKALKGIYPELTVINTDELLEYDEADIEAEDEILCVITDDENFPSHYIVLTDTKSLIPFMKKEDYYLQSALMAVKGFNPKNHTLKPYEADKFEDITWNIIGEVAEREFAAKDRDTLKSVTIYSDFMLLSLTQTGVIKDRNVFLDFAPVKVDHDPSRKTHITLHFKSGNAVTLLPQEEQLENTAKEEASMKGDLRSSVLDGLFGK